MATDNQFQRRPATRPTSVALGLDQLDELHEIKARERTSVGQIIRVAVDEYIARDRMRRGLDDEAIAA